MAVGATAAYPKAVASWTARIDNVNTVYAADPNTLAAEILAVESALGPMPQVESPVPVGSPLTYSTVGDRINAAMLQTAHPYAELYKSNFKVGYGKLVQVPYLLNYAVYNSFSVVEDEWNYFNGSDITIQAPGVYLIDGFQVWDFYTSGWLFHMLVINGAVARGDLWQWNFPTSGPNSENYDGHWARTGWAWMGPLAKGDRVRVASQNATTKNPYTVVGSSLRVYYLRSLTSSEIGSNVTPS